MKVDVEEFANALSALPPRGSAIFRVTVEGFEAILTGRAKCVNVPDDLRIERVVFDPVYDAMLFRASSTEFGVIAEGEPAPERDVVCEMFRHK